MIAVSGSGRLRTVLLVLGLTLCIGPSPAAQEPPEDLTTLPAKALIDRTVAAVAAVDAIAARRIELKARIEPIATELSDNAVQVQAFSIPDAPDPARQPTEPDAVQEIIDQWQARAEALKALQGLLTTRQGLADRHREAALLLASELTLLAQAQKAAQPALDELTARRDAGDIQADSVPERLQTEVSWPAQDVLAEAAADWNERAARDQVIAAGAETAFKQRGADGTQAEAALATARDWLAEATERAALREDLEGREASDLVSQFTLKLSEVESESRSLTERLTALSEAAESRNAAKAELETLSAPSDAPVPGSDGATAAETEALRRARASLALAQATTAFRADQLARREALLAETTDLQDTVGGLVEAVGAVVTEWIELEVVADVLRDQADLVQDLPEAAANRRLRRETRGWKDWREVLAERRAALQAEVTALETAIDEGRTGLAEAEKAVEDRTRAVDREAEWASFIAQMENLAPDALRQALDEAAASVVAATTALEEASAETTAAQERAAEASAALAGHHNPVVLAKRTDDAAFNDWLLDQGIRAADQADDAGAEGESVAAEGPAQPAAAPAEAETAPEEGAAPSRVRDWLADARHQRDQLVVRRLQYYRKRTELRQDLVAALVAHRLTLEAERSAAEAALAAARRAWGAATLLQTRQAQGAIDDANLSEIIKPWLDRQAVAAHQDTVSQLSSALDTVVARETALAEAPDEDALVDALARWDDQASLIVERLSEYLSLRSQAAALANVDELDELERRMLDRAIEDRISRDLGVYRQLDYYFATQESSTIDELLNRYYSRLIVLERQVENIDKRQAQLETAAKRTEETRATLEPVATRLTELVADGRAALQRELVTVKAALFPSEAPSLLAAFAEQTGTEIDPAAVPRLPTDGEDAERAAARANLIENLRDDWARVAGFRAWAAFVDGQAKSLGGIDERVGRYRDLLAELASAKAELERTIARLVGYDPAELDKLVATGAVGAEDPRRLALGEIGLLKQERQQLLQWRMVESGISLVAIPLIAFVIILIIRSVGRRLIARAILSPTDGRSGEHGSDRREQEVRAATLSSILSKVMGTLVIILAVIYMLNVVNIDVTPVIASLGVLGLAVAFGAQSLMKDVFSGFFLLLENQLNRGDWVTINGLVGKVEEIGLRMTVIRDFTDGQVHFIPNGTISQVSNFNKEWSRVNVRIATPYEIDADQAYNILARVAEEMKGDASVNENIRDISMAPAVATIDYETGSLCFGVFVDVRNAAFGLAWTYRMRAKKALEAADIPLAIARQIEIAVPYGDGSRIDGLVTKGQSA